MSGDQEQLCNLVPKRVASIRVALLQAKAREASNPPTNNCNAWRRQGPKEPARVGKGRTEAQGAGEGRGMVKYGDKTVTSTYDDAMNDLFNSSSSDCHPAQPRLHYRDYNTRAELFRDRYQDAKEDANDAVWHRLVGADDLSRNSLMIGRRKEQPSSSCKPSKLAFAELIQPVSPK